MAKRRESGGAVLWVIVLLLLVGTFVGYRVGQVYFDHETFKSQIQNYGDQAIIDTSFDARMQIVRLFESSGITLDPETVRVDFNEKHDRVTIAFDYERDIDLTLARPSFSFRIYEQREAAKPAAIVQGFQQSVEESNAAPARRYQQDIKKSFEGAGSAGATGE